MKLIFSPFLLVCVLLLHSCTRQDKEELVFYTSPAATTPQIPFWYSVKTNLVRSKPTIRTETWRDMDFLSALILSGKGDIWLGHTEAFARAYLKGAPLVYLAVTGQRKFYIISSDPQVTSVDKIVKKKIFYAPRGGAILPLLSFLLNKTGCEFIGMEPLSLVSEIKRGQLITAVLPEPNLTLLLEDIKNLKIIGNVEELVATTLGLKNRTLPLAGIAVNKNLTMTKPVFVQELRNGILIGGALLRNASPEYVLDFLPNEFFSYIPRGLIEKSLSRDLISAENAKDRKREIVQYLKIVAPDINNIDDDFFYQQ